jgi:phosphatidylglycerophosphatase A
MGARNAFRSVGADELRSGTIHLSKKIRRFGETAYDGVATRKERMERSPRSTGNQVQNGNLRPWPEVFAASRVTTVVATWFGVGFLPAAPGTWGSLAAIPVAYLVAFLSGAWGLSAFALGITLIGVHAAGETARLRGAGDPPEIVVDEVAGQSIALLPVYALVPAGATFLRIGAALSAFLLFRVLDVWKPGPIGIVERLPRGWGIMADDVLAGAVAAAFVGTALLVTR